MRSIASLIWLGAISFHSLSGAPIDSTKRTGQSMVATPRFNTLNMAPVSGNIVNNHANVDFTFVYTKNRFMWTTAFAVDLEDSRSEMNYFLTNVRFKINFTKHFGVSPFLAFYSEHAHQLFDPVSDMNGGLLFSYRCNRLVIEAFFLAVRLTHPTIERDVINRFEIKYNFKFIVLSGFIYQNTSYFDSKRRLAVGFKTIFPKFTIFEKLAARSEVTGSFRIDENPATTNLNGVFLSLAFPLNI